MIYEELNVNEYIDQYIKYMESNKKLIELFQSENVHENWIQDYHIYDRVWINSWKEIISFKDLVKEGIEDKNKIFEIIKQSLNSGTHPNLKFDYKSIYDEKCLINPIKPFDLISDDVWKLFSKSNDNKSCDGKVSLLIGKNKIIICLNEYCYSVRYLTKSKNFNKQYINDYNEFIVIFNSKKSKKQEMIKKIINEIATSNIDDWMKKIDFKFNVKQFSVKDNEISYDIKQKYSNWNFLFIRKYGKTSNICAVMRALSTIEPLTDYFMNNINDKTITDVSSSLMDSFKKYFYALWSNEGDWFMPQELCENIRNLKGENYFNIKEEQDPFKFLRLIINHLNEKLNQKDTNINFNFNNIIKRLGKLSENLEHINDLNKIINESNSIIGKLFYGLTLEFYRCDNCKKNFHEKIKKFDIIDINYIEVVIKVNKSGEDSFINSDVIDFFIKEDFKIDKNKDLPVECNTCKNSANFKKEILSCPPFLLVRLNRGELEGKKGFVNNVDIPNHKIRYDTIKFNEDILSNIIKKQNKKHKDIEYDLISMVNYLKIEDKIEFINLSKSPFLIEDPKNKEKKKKKKGR